MKKTSEWHEKRHTAQLDKRKEKQYRTERHQKARNQRRALKSRSRGIPDGFPVPQHIMAYPPFLQVLNRWQPEPVEKRAYEFPVREWRRTG